MKKKLFNPLIDPTKIPGFQSRFKSLDSLLGETLTESYPQADTFFSEKNLRGKIKSALPDAALPSKILRRRGR